MRQGSASSTVVGKKIDDYVLTNVLGEGAFGKVTKFTYQEVFEASNITTKKLFAIKTVPKSKLKEHNGLVGELIQTEVQVLLQCNNENVVKMVKYLESENNCYMVMEYCNQGDFDQLWKRRNKVIPEHEAIGYLKQILNGMKGLHELNVIHRDLKLANILIDSNVLKIGDLGFAKKLSNKDEQTNTALGTLGCMAPEVIEFKPYGLLADMFSLGAIYYQMLFGQLPFSIKSYDEFLRDIKSRKPNFQTGNIKVSKETQDLLSQMLQYDPRQRMKWTVIYDHPLFKGEKNAMLNPMTISNLAGRQVDINGNRDMYKQRQDLNQLEGNNMIQTIQGKNKIFAQPQKVRDDEQSDENSRQEYYTTALNNKRRLEDTQAEIDRTIQCYMSKRNSLVFLATLLDIMHKHTHDESTNVYLPAFMLAKKLLLENEQMLKIINGHQNIFNCKNLGDLYNNKIFINFIRSLESDGKILEDHFKILLKQCIDIFSKMQNPNQQLVGELQKHPSNSFEENYKNTLFQYYFQMQDEVSKAKRQEAKNSLTNMCLYILDAISFNKGFQEEVINNIQNQCSQVNFRINEYFESLEFQTEEEKNKMIESKFLKLF